MMEYEIMLARMAGVSSMIPITKTELQDRKKHLALLLCDDLIAKETFQNELDRLEKRCLSSEQLAALRDIVNLKLKAEGFEDESVFSAKDLDANVDAEENDNDSQGTINDADHTPEPVEGYEELCELLEKFGQQGHSFKDIYEIIQSMKELKPNMWKGTDVPKSGTLRDFKNLTTNGWDFNKSSKRWCRRMHPVKIHRCTQALKLYESIREF